MIHCMDLIYVQAFPSRIFILSEKTNDLWGQMDGFCIDSVVCVILH